MQIDLTLSRLVIKSEAGSRPLLDILAGKDEKFVSSLNPAERKILYAASALKESWNSLSLFYVHEVMLMLEDKVVSDIAVNHSNKNIDRQSGSHKI